MPEVKGIKTPVPPRWKQYQSKKGRMPTIPEVGYGSHLLRYLFEFGPTDKEGAAVSFQEIESWARMARRRVDGWDVMTLRMMSQAYAGQAYKSKNPDCKSPLDEGKQTEADRKAEASEAAVSRFRELNTSRRSKRRRGRRV